MRNSIRGRMTVVFIGVAIIPLLIVGFILAQLSFSVQQQQALALQHELAQRIRAQVEVLIVQRETELRIAADVQPLGHFERDDQVSILSELQTYVGAYETLILMDAEGQELVNLSRWGTTTDQGMGLRAWSTEFTSPLNKDETYYSPVRIEQSTGEPLITIGLPLHNNETGEIEGVLIADIRFKPVWDLIAATDVSEEQTIYIVDADGRVVAHRTPSVVLRRTTVDLPNADGFTTGIDGTQVVLSTVPIQLGDQTLIIVAEHSAQDALALAYNTIYITAAIILAALLVATLVGIISVGRIAQPIQELAKAANDIRGGNLARRVEIRSTDELGDLASSFNTMSSQLNELVTNLEERVTERTRDLKVASDVARHITTKLDLNELLPVLVQQTKESFGMYFVSVFLYHADSNLLMIAAGTDEVGQRLKAERPSLHLDSRPSLIAQAARDQHSLVINNVRTSPDYLPDVLLPDTRSELVLPMIVGGELIGVLDIQSDREGRFMPEDVEILSTLAEQIAIAVKNATLYEVQVQVAVEMRRADEIKSQFLASMSHELRTPLNAILTFTELIMQGVFGPVNDEQKDYLQKSLSSGRHLLSLINDVLDISKIQSGMLKLFMEDDFDIAKEMRNIADTAERLLDGKPVQLNVQIDTDFPPLMCDKRRIRQVMLNLISNAIKFTVEGSITLSAEKRDGNALFSVIDTGPGIRLEDQAIMFAPFIQTETGIKHGGGTGLGLPISKSLVEAHGGKIWVDSTLGNGAAFYVALPLTPAPTPEPAPTVLQGA